MRWHKQPGEPVEAGEVVGMVEVDVAEFELFAPATGTLAELLVEPGETATVGQQLAEFGSRREGSISGAALGRHLRDVLNAFRRPNRRKGDLLACSVSHI